MQPGRDRRTLVGNGDRHMPAPGVRRDIDGRSGRGKPDRVVEQVADDTVHLDIIGHEERQIGVQAELDAERGQGRSEPPHARADQLVHIAPIAFQAERARFDPGLVQQVAHQAVEPVGLLVDGREEIGAGGRIQRGILLQQNGRRRFDRRQRGPQIVRDRRKQRRLQPVTFFEELRPAGFAGQLGAFDVGPPARRKS